MSGDAAGIGGGSVLVLLFLPQIVTIAAVTAAGTAAVGGAIALTKCVGQFEKKRESRKLEQDEYKSCSAEIAQFIKVLSEHDEKIGKEEDKFIEDISLKLREYSQKQLDIASNFKISETGDQLISDSAEQFLELVRNAFEVADEELEREYEKEDRVEKELLTQLKTINYSARSLINEGEDQFSILKQRAESVSTDVKAFLDIVRDNDMFTDNDYLQVELYKLVNQMEEQVQNGLFEAAIITGKGIINRAQSLMIHDRKKREKKKALKAKLICMYEGLSSWLGNIRYIERPADHQYNHDIKEDLNDFSQGKIEELESSIRQKLYEIENNSDKWDIDTLSREVILCDTVTYPKAQELIRKSVVVLGNYLKRVDMIEYIADFFVGQNYEIEWCNSQGNDCSQKLVSHFVNYTSGNRISVVLDPQDNTDEYSDIDIAVYDYGENNSELQRQDLREAMSDALKRKGIILNAPLQCDERTKNQASNKQEYLDVNTVINMPIVRII